MTGIRDSSGFVTLRAVFFVAAAALAIGYFAGAFSAGVGLKSGRAFARATALGEFAMRKKQTSYVDTGRRVYERHCGMCHGISEDDRVRRARSAFSNYGDFGVFRRIAYSRKHGDFRHMSAGLGDSELLASVAYLRSLSERAEPGTRPSGPLPDGRYEYVSHWGGVTVYDIDHGFEPVRFLRVPQLRHQHGIEANLANGLLYLSFRRDGLGVPEQSVTLGQLMAIDLLEFVPLWTADVRPGIDSFAVTADGEKIYMPTGEEGEGRSQWVVLDARTGAERSRIEAATKAHNTILSPDGAFAYLGATEHDELIVVDTQTDLVVDRVGRFGAGIRPFALTSDGRFAAVNVNYLSGFEIADLETREVIHRVEVEGWPWEDPPLPAAQSHGVAFSPDEREAWVNDAWNKRVHRFDTSELPRKPRYLGSIDVSPPYALSDDDKLAELPKWIRFTRDGRWVHISNGAIVDANSHEIAHWVLPSRHYLEVHWAGGRPVAAFPRYGNGYRAHEGAIPR